MTPNTLEARARAVEIAPHRLYRPAIAALIAFVAALFVLGVAVVLGSDLERTSKALLGAAVGLAGVALVTPGVLWLRATRGKPALRLDADGIVWGADRTRSLNVRWAEIAAIVGAYRYGSAALLVALKDPAALRSRYTRAQRVRLWLEPDEAAISIGLGDLATSRDELVAVLRARFDGPIDVADLGRKPPTLNERDAARRRLWTLGVGSYLACVGITGAAIARAHEAWAEPLPPGHAAMYMVTLTGWVFGVLGMGYERLNPDQRRYGTVFFAVWWALALVSTVFLVLGGELPGGTPATAAGLALAGAATPAAASGEYPVAVLVLGLVLVIVLVLGYLALASGVALLGFYFLVMLFVAAKLTSRRLVAAQLMLGISLAAVGAFVVYAAGPDVWRKFPETIGPAPPVALCVLGLVAAVVARRIAAPTESVLERS